MHSDFSELHRQLCHVLRRMRISLWVGFGDGEVFEVSSLLHRLFWGVADHVECAEPPDLQLSARRLGFTGSPG